MSPQKLPGLGGAVVVVVGGWVVVVVGPVVVGPVPVARTANSNSEYPYGVARTVPFIRT